MNWLVHRAHRILKIQAAGANINKTGQKNIEVPGHSERNPALLFFANDDWGEYWQTRHHIVSRMAQRDWPVFYTRNIFARWDVNKPAWKHSNWLPKREMRDRINFYWPGRLHTGWPRLAKLDNYLRYWQMADILRDMSAVGKSQPIAYLFHPNFAHYLKFLTGFKIVYHADDTFSAMGDFDAGLVQQERELVQRADLVIASSQLMAEALPAVSGKSIVLLENGADTRAFECGGLTSLPEVLQVIPTPRIGYIGTINDKVDMLRIADIAQARADWHWCIVGRVIDQHNLCEATISGLERCRALANVHFLGEFSTKELPAIAGHMDVNTMIYRTDGHGWWKNIYPLKMHEYLATGKSVVSSHVDAVLQFSDVVDIIPENGTAHDWVASLDKAIKGCGAGGPDLRRRVARANDWNNRIDELTRLLRAL